MPATIVPPSSVPAISDRELEVLDWTLESIEPRLDAAARELDRFFAEAAAHRERLAWGDQVAAGLLLMEAQLEEFFDHGLPPKFDEWNDLAEALLHHSDWLLWQADEVTESFGEHRIALRLIGLAGACFEAARRIPPRCLIRPLPTMNHPLPVSPS